jgi:2-amino-4-hydroxy-6-hydroxymethyldihydropteridine diphosphokinase
MHYILALGSNRCHGRYGPPKRVVEAAVDALGVGVTARSRTFATPALGPSHRRFANAAVLIETDLDPEELLDHLKDVERIFGRRRGKRWGARVLDLDIILWSEGAWSSPALTIPHPEFRHRDFVLTPLLEIAAHWHDPISGQSVRHLKAQLDRPRRRP